MNISSLINFNNVQKSTFVKRLISFTGTRFNQPAKDTADFTTFNRVFSDKKEGEAAAKRTAKHVAELLKDGDDYNALEILGYDFDSDFETDKRTIHGDFTPFVIYKGGKFVPYEELGIDTTKLLQNVEKIEGITYTYPLSQMDDSGIKLNYGASVGTREWYIHRALFKKRIDKAKAELKKSGDTNKALNILGYETEVDENGKITILGDYNLTGYNSLKRGQEDDVKIDENKLLKDVVKIKGNVSFKYGFEPDHYIDVDNFNGYGDNEVEFLKLSPEFQDKIKTLQEVFNSGDNFAALQKAGYNVEKDEDGKITINGDYRPCMTFPFKNRAVTVSYEEMGIDDKDILKGVKRITGNVSLGGSNIEELKDVEIDGNLILRNSPYGSKLPPKVKTLGKNVKVGGFVLHYNIPAKTAFANYHSAEDIAKECGNKSAKTINYLFENGILSCNLKSKSGGYYIGNIEGRNKEILDEVTQRKDEILSTDEICERYSVEPLEFSQIVHENGIKPYLTGPLTNRNRLPYLLFDLKDEENIPAFSTLELRKKIKDGERITDPDKYSTSALFNEVKAKLANTEEDVNTHCCTAKELEKYGYGTLADIVANYSKGQELIDMGRKFFRGKQFDISDGATLDLLNRARANNPNNVSIAALRKPLGKDYKKFLAAIINKDVDVITTEATQLSSFSRYVVPLFNDKNYEYFKNIDNKEFQDWLTERKESLDKYQRRNRKRAVLLQNALKLPEKERNANVLQIVKADIKHRKAEEKARIEKINAKIEKIKEKRDLKMSFVSTIAWYLSPNTRAAMQANMNPYIRELMGNKEVVKELKAGDLDDCYSEEEITDLIQLLELSEKEANALKGYFKRSWETAQGSEEFSNGLIRAYELADLYFEQGIDAIENKDIKERIKKWENDKLIN